MNCSLRTDKVRFLERRVLELKHELACAKKEITHLSEESKRDILTSVILESINESEREKEKILDSLVEQVFFLDLDFKIKWMNTAGIRSLDCDDSAVDYLESCCYSAIYGRNNPCDDCPVVTTLKTGWPWKEEVTHSDGKTYLVSSQPVTDDNGRMKGVAVILLDITMRKDVEATLEKSQQRSRVLLSAITDLMIVFNDQGFFIDYHASSDSDLISSYDDLEGRHLKTVLPQKLSDLIFKNCSSISSAGSLRAFEYSQQSRDGSQTSYYECRLVKSGQHEFACIIRDITARRTREKDIFFKSFHDMLTGLYNRAYFEEEIKRIEKSRKALPTSVLVIDVNGLKLTNDAFGHAYGDILLKKIADIISSSCRKSDVIARTGGDEFAILLPGTPLKKAELLARRIHETCDSCCFDDIFTRPSVSIGSAEKSDDSSTIHDTMHIADERMYRMKLATKSEHMNRIIEDILSTMKLRSGESENHIARLINMSVILAKDMNLSEDRIEKLELLAKLHDLGKIRLPAEILTRNGALNEEEYKLVKQHSIIGYRIVKAIPEYSPIADLVLCHHERWDGRGYPSGLKAKEIPLESRIFSLVDSFDTMIHNSVYKPSKSLEQALNELTECSGTQFDPDIVARFIKLIQSGRLDNALEN